MFFAWESGAYRVQCFRYCFAVFVSSKSARPERSGHVRQASCSSSSALRQGLWERRCLEIDLADYFHGVTSLRHVSLRGTGWSRDPTSSGRSRSEPKGKATYGQVRNSLSSLHSVLIEVLKRLRYRGSRGSFASFRRPTPCLTVQIGRWNGRSRTAPRKR